MKHVVAGILVVALLLMGWVPWAMAGTQIQLKQSDGSITTLGGSGDSAKVTCGNCSGTGASFVDDAAFVPGSDSGAPAMGLFDDVSPDSVNEGDVGVVRMSANRNAYTTIRDAAGNERGANVNASNELLTSANTELPTPAVPANGTALSAMPSVFSVNGCYNGSTVDLCPKGSAGAGAVDATTARVTLASDDPLFTGSSNDHYVSVGTTEDKHQVKATAGRLLAIQVSNSAATVAYLRCANLTAANTTPGTSTVFWGMAIPGATTGAGMTAQIGGVNGLAFSTALTCWVVTDKAESGVTEVGAGDVQWNIQHK